MIQRPALAIFLAAPGAAMAQYIDRAGNVVDDGGGGSLGAASLVLGALVAGWFIYTSIAAGESLGSIVVAAWFGFLVGVVLGFPVSCVSALVAGGG